MNLNNRSRNPVGVLHEKYQCGGLKPVYQLIRATGPPNDPIFSFQVSLGKMTSVGKGSSKKQAKIAAAQSMLDILDEEKTVKEDQENVSDVRILEELCAKHGYNVPIYDDEREQNEFFSIICSVGEVKKTGVGPSLGQAKNEAAQRMIDVLKSLHSDTASGKSQEDSFYQDKLMEETQNKLSDKSNHPVTVKETLNYEKELLSRLQTMNLKEKGDYMIMLLELGKQENVVVTCVHEKLGDMTMCLIQLNTLPVAVSFGIGDDSANIQNDAARNMLTFLKMLTVDTNRL